MPEISLEQIVKRFGIGEYQGLRGSGYAVKLADMNDVSEFAGVLSKAGVSYGGKTIAFNVYFDSGHCFVEFESETFPLTEPVTVEWRLAPEVAGRPAAALSSYLLKRVLEGLANAVAKNFSDDVAKEYTGVRGLDTAFIIAKIGDNIFRLDYTRGENFDSAELSFGSNATDKASNQTIIVRDKSLRDETEAFVEQAISMALSSRP
jgi:hypothetical protein